MAEDFSSMKFVSMSMPTTSSPSSESDSRLKSLVSFCLVYALIPSSFSIDLIIWLRTVSKIGAMPDFKILEISEK
jgi:hypothetical protein